MGAFTVTQGAFTASKTPAVSVGGGLRVYEVLTRGTMGATYATGGDTVAIPTAPTNYDLWAVEIVSYTRVAGISIHWDQSTSAPKLIAYDEDDTSGIEAQLANASTALAAAVVTLRFIFVAGL